MKPRRSYRPHGSKPAPRSRPGGGPKARPGSGGSSDVRPFGGHPGPPPSTRPGYKPRPPMGRDAGGSYAPTPPPPGMRKGGKAPARRGPDSAPKIPEARAIAHV